MNVSATVVATTMRAVDPVEGLEVEDVWSAG
jgi:hypothetical protein